MLDGSAEFTFDAELWLSEGDAPWCFVTLPEDVSDDIEEATAGQRRGFGSVRVEVTAGGTTWRTSVFPDTRRRAHVLPVKAEVRRREGLAVGDRVSLALRVLDG